MKNQLQHGDAISVTAPAGGLTSGNPYMIGAALFGVAGATVAAGLTGVLWLKGAFTLPKISAQAWAVSR